MVYNLLHLWLTFITFVVIVTFIVDITLMGDTFVALTVSFGIPYF